jgi:hypothetical protein
LEYSFISTGGGLCFAQFAREKGPENRLFCLTANASGFPFPAEEDSQGKPGGIDERAAPGVAIAGIE